MSPSTPKSRIGLLRRTEEASNRGLLQKCARGGADDADRPTDERRSGDGHLNDDSSHTSGEDKQRFSKSLCEENKKKCDGEDDTCPGVNESSAAEHEHGARDGAGGAGRQPVDDSAEWPV